MSDIVDEMIDKEFPKLETKVKFCPYCGEKFEFESSGKYERITKEVKTRQTVYKATTTLKRLK